MAIKYSITGTAMNWSANTWGQLVADGVIDHPVTNARLTPAVSPGWGALGAAKVEINGTLYTVASNTADDLTITAVGPSNGTYSWALFNEGPPGDGDTARLNGGAVTMDIGTIPATGTLSILEAKNTANTDVAGYLSCVMTGAQFHTIGIINATNIIAGTYTNGIIYITGTDITHSLQINGSVTAGTAANAYGVNNTVVSPLIVSGTLTGGSASSAIALRNGTTANITCGSLIAGSDTGAAGLYNMSTATVEVTGNISGSADAGAVGFYNYGAGIVTITGSITGGGVGAAYGLHNRVLGSVTINGAIITGGSHIGAYGVYNEGAGEIIFNNCSLICDAAVPYVGTVPVWNNDDNASYYEQPNTGRSNKFGTIPMAGTMATETVCGDTTGTRIDCPEEAALTTSGNYGDPDDPFVGTYVDEGGGGGDIIIGRFFNRGFS